MKFEFIGTLPPSAKVAAFRGQLIVVGPTFLPFVIDPSVPPGELQVRAENGRVLGRIINLWEGEHEDGHSGTTGGQPRRLRQ